MTTRTRSCYRLSLSKDIRAACEAFLRECKLTAREISAKLHISPASVYDVRRAAGLPIANRDGSRRRRPEQSRKDLPTCQWCGLLAPCTCTGPAHAADFLGRRDEPVCSGLGY